MKFLIEYLKHPLTIGAIAPSSRFLAKKMIALVDFQQCHCIIEFGPGTGVFTKEMIKRKKDSTILLIIEQNKDFYGNLKEKYGKEKNVLICHGSAAKVQHYMEKYNIDSVDYIISGLPFASLPKETSHHIFKATQQVIGKKGVFITFQYTLFKKHIFTKYFQIHNLSFEPVNLPPAFVLNMKNK